MNDVRVQLDGNGIVTLVAHKDKLRAMVEDSWSDSAMLTGQAFLEDLLDNADEAAGGKRYVISDGWTHIFTEGDAERERVTRWAYDRETRSLAVLDIMRENKWRAAEDAERADVLDSLLNGNPGCLDNPAAWEFSLSETLPSWS